MPDPFIVVLGIAGLFIVAAGVINWLVMRDVRKK
jgi:hypothetical protein